MPIDHVLKLYSESVRSPYLHYGFWDNPESVNASEFTLNEMVKAQGRYIEHLVSFIPEDVKTVLDVGAGIGGNSSYLLSKGYEVEALSPDEYQETVFAEKYNGEVKFHRSKFEDFKPEKNMIWCWKVKVLVISRLNRGGKQQEKPFGMVDTYWLPIIFFITMMVVEIGILKLRMMKKYIWRRQRNLVLNSYGNMIRRKIPCQR